MQHVIDYLGGPAAVARVCACKPPSVIEWRKRGVPPARCPALERATEGRFRVEQIRPDVSWRRVADAAWPWHPDGRPLLDVAGEGALTARADHSTPRL
jgi:hypothetical protein